MRRMQTQAHPLTPPGTPDRQGRPDRLLTILEVGAQLGISRRTTYRLIETGELPVVHVTSDCVRIKPSDVDALIERKRGFRQ